MFLEDAVSFSLPFARLAAQNWARPESQDTCTGVKPCATRPGVEDKGEGRPLAAPIPASSWSQLLLGKEKALSLRNVTTWIRLH